MIGCGRGFVVARPQAPAMVPFLLQQTDRFSCDAIPADARLGTEDMFQQGSWRYLMLTVGYTWRIFGVAWSALGPLFALLFGATIAILYGIFRLAMSPALAVAGALLLRVSALHLRYFLVLRDYTKAPFTLLLIFLLGLLVVRRVTWRGALSIAAVYGAVVGIGYGFRPDFLSDLPPLFITLFAFLRGGVFRNIGLKLAAAAACVTMFVTMAWPVLSSMSSSRPGCQWHVVLLGFAQQFSGPLGVEPAPYEVNREYLDEFAYTTVTSYAARLHPGIGHIDYCEPEYGAATRAYLMEVVRRFPADVIVRAYASVLRIVELPFTDRPNEDVSEQAAHNVGYGVGLPIVVAAIVLATIRNTRIGLFLLFFLLYFGGLPATQFDARHFFHLEFIGWWAAAFLLQAVMTRFSPASPQHRSSEESAPLRRAIVVLTGCVAVLVSTLWAARAYQQTSVRSLVAGYLAAAREPLNVGQAQSARSPSVVRITPHTDPETADVIAVDLNGSKCGAHTSVAFRYDDSTRRAYSRVFDVRGEVDQHDLTHIFMPIYDGFERLDFTDAPPGCVDGVYRVREPGRFSLLLEVMLRPGWRRAPFYQRLRGPLVPRLQ